MSPKLSLGCQLAHFGGVYAYQMFHRCGLDYLSYDLTEAPIVEFSI